jgi:hypothetical protein
MRLRLVGPRCGARESWRHSAGRGGHFGLPSYGVGVWCRVCVAEWVEVGHDATGGRIKKRRIRSEMHYNLLRDFVDTAPMSITHGCNRGDLSTPMVPLDHTLYHSPSMKQCTSPGQPPIPGPFTETRRRPPSTNDSLFQSSIHTPTHLGPVLVYTTAETMTRQPGTHP